jgi:putative aldouronate transport system substrate-binding protein
MNKTILTVLVMALCLGIAGAFATGQVEEVGTAGPRWNGERYDPPITLTFAGQQSPDEVFPEGDSVEDYVYTRWAEEHLGIIWEAKWISVDGETYNQKLNLATASGDLPDSIWAAQNEMTRLIRAGVTLPLEGLMEDHASGLVKYLFNEHEDYTDGAFSAAYRHQDDLYAFPVAADISGVWHTNWIRKDILDELGMDPPETVADLEAALEAYHEQYPDNPAHLITKGMFMGMETVMQAFGAHPKRWTEDENGELAYGSIQPEAKQALAVLADWYEKGYLDPEFIVKDWGKVQEDWASGNALSVHGNWWYIYTPFPALWENVPDSEIVAYPPLKGPEGQSEYVTSVSFGQATAINANTEYPEALFYELNEQLDSRLRSKTELRELVKEANGYEFEYPVTENRGPLNPDVGNGNLFRFDYEVTGPGYFNEPGPGHYKFLPGIQWGQRYNETINRYRTIYEYVSEGKLEALGELNPGWLRNYKGLHDAEPRKWNTHIHNYIMLADLLESGFMTFDKNVYPPTPTMADRQAYLDKIEEETYAKIIIGDLPVDAFDDFVEDWLASGGADITEELNALYLGGGQ